MSDSKNQIYISVRYAFNFYELDQSLYAPLVQYISS